MRVLIVEDEPMVAADLEMIIESMGHSVAGVADTRQAAFALMETRRIDAAFVDVRLQDGPTGLEVAERLLERLDIPVIFMTANAELVPGGGGQRVRVLHKPVAEDHVREVISAIAQRRPRG